MTDKPIDYLHVSERVCAFGPRSLFVDVADTVGAVCEQLAAQTTWADWTSEDEDVFVIEPRARASDTALAALVGVGAFLGSWAASKALDEVYTHTLRPALLDLYARVMFKPERVYAISLSVCHVPSKTVLMLVALGVDVDTLRASERLIPMALDRATAWAQANASSLPVHLYRIEGGQVAPVPLLFSSIDVAVQSLERAVPLQLPKYLNALPGGKAPQ